MRITAFAGSNSSKSINKQLVEFALTYFPGAEVNLLDLNDYEMPIFSLDREKGGYPDLAHQFAEQINETDIIICSLAENNHTYSAAFKNVLDWVSRIDYNIFKGKPMLLMSTSPGGYGGGNVMNAAKKLFPGCGAEIRETFSLPKFQNNFKQGKGIINADFLNEFESKITAFKEEIL